MATDAAPTGRAVCNLSVAYTTRVKDEQSGEWRDSDTEWYKVTAWGQMAEHCAETLQRGDRVIACGEWVEVTYDSHESESVTRTEMNARDVGPSLLFRHATIARTERKGGK